MEAVDDAEMARYEAAVELPEKVNAVTAAMEAMIDEGQLTAREKAALVPQLRQKAEALEADAAKASGKRAEKLAEAAAKVRARADRADANPPFVHAIPNDKKLVKLYRELAELERIEKAQQQSLDVIRKLERKPDVEAEIARIEGAARGLFEDGCDTQQQLEKLRADARKADAAKKPAANSGGGFTKVGSARRPPSARGGGGGGGRPANAFALLDDM